MPAPLHAIVRNRTPNHFLGFLNCHPGCSRHLGHCLRLCSTTSVTKLQMEGIPDLAALYVASSHMRRFVLCSLLLVPS